MKHGLKLAVTSLCKGNNEKYEILKTKRKKKKYAYDSHPDLVLLFVSN